jgi:hypothetical protein
MRINIFTLDVFDLRGRCSQRKPRAHFHLHRQEVDNFEIEGRMEDGCTVLVGAEHQME